MSLMIELRASGSCSTWFLSTWFSVSGSMAKVAATIIMLTTLNEIHGLVTSKSYKFRQQVAPKQGAGTRIHFVYECPTSTYTEWGCHSFARFKDVDLGSFPGRWAASVATYCPSTPSQLAKIITSKPSKRVTDLPNFSF